MKMMIELVPIETPDYVIQKLAPGDRHTGIRIPSKFELHEIPAETLDELCNEFRAEIFRKAGKDDPIK